MEEVLNINDYLYKNKERVLSKDLKRQDERLQKRVRQFEADERGVDCDQYRKYVILLNVTNNNNRLTGAVTFTDIYLAENK